MKEVVTEALVLKVLASGENNKLVIFLTEELGRLKARAVGANKILSKFSPHLEVGNFVELRLAGNSAWTITDVLTIKPSLLRASTNNLEKISSAFRLLDSLSTPTADSDLWKLICNTELEFFSPKIFLDFFGYSQEHSACFKCGAHSPEYFYLPDHSFFCAAHAVEISTEHKIRCNI
jgi:recombinational DNA repair protein (RecF pathway)